MPAEPAAVRLRNVGERLPGLALAVVIAVVAALVGRLAPIVGGPVAGIVLGVLIGSIRRPAASLQAGITFSSRFGLQLSVVLLGSQLSPDQVALVGVESLPVTLGALVICLAAAWLVSRRANPATDLPGDAPRSRARGCGCGGWSRGS